MLPSEQIRRGTDQAYAGMTPPKAGTWERYGYDQEQLQLEQQRRREEPVVAPLTTASVPQARRGFGVFGAMKLLGAIGFVLAGAAGGLVANRLGYSPRDTAVIAALLAMFGASLGAAIPPLTKAIGWVLLSAAVAAVGAAALRALGILVPEFLERILG